MSSNNAKMSNFKIFFKKRFTEKSRFSILWL